MDVSGQTGNQSVLVYIGLNEAQQVSIVERMAKQQSYSINSCASDLSTLEIRDYFNQWIESNPGVLNRDAMLAFTSAILDLCETDVENEQENKLNAIENGKWTALPYILGYCLVDVYNDFTFKSTDSEREINNLFSESVLDMTAMFSKQLYVETGFFLAPAGEPPSGDIFFENHGLRITKLALTWDREVFWLSAGKGTVNHGIAYISAAGIWGGDILFDVFSIQERIGFAGNINVGNDNFGHHAIYAGLFQADNTFLSRPYFSAGKTVKISDGGPSNTKGFNSYVLTLDGSGFSSLGGLRYHISGLKQGVSVVNDLDGNPLGKNMVDHEYRLVASLNYSNLEITETFSLTPLTEYGLLQNARGIKDRKEHLLTASLLINADHWNISFAGTFWNIAQPDIGETDHKQLQLSVGYYFTNGIGCDVGYRYQDLFDEQLHTLGFAFSYSIPFAN